MPCERAERARRLIAQQRGAARRTRRRGECGAYVVDENLDVRCIDGSIYVRGPVVAGEYLQFVDRYFGKRRNQRAREKITVAVSHGMADDSLGRARQQTPGDVARVF